MSAAPDVSRTERRKVPHNEIGPQLVQEDFYSSVARARLMTCATGAALAWEDAEGMVCRASTGLAPATGTRVQLDHGLSGECIRTAAVVRCNDAQSDSRVDPEVCRQLRLRSAVIVPVLRYGKVVGLIEVFSSKPGAFREEDIGGLRTLAKQCAGETNVQDETNLERNRVSSLHELWPQARKRPVLASVAGIALFLAGAQFAVRHLVGPVSTDNRAQHAAAETSAKLKVSAGNSAIPAKVSETSFSKGESAADFATRERRGAKSNVTTRNQSAPESQHETEIVVRQYPSAAFEQRSTLSSNAQGISATEIPPPTIAVGSGQPDQKTIAALDASLPTLPHYSVSATRSGEVTPARLVRNVRPGYPQWARLARSEGTVVLRVKIGVDGRVGDIAVVSGDRAFGNAAIDAVRQWRYAPYKLNGKPVEGETNVTIRFSMNEQR